MSNFIGMVFATLKKEGIDTSKMDTSEAIAKYNEIKDKGENEKENVVAKQDVKKDGTDLDNAKDKMQQKDSSFKDDKKEVGGNESKKEEKNSTEEKVIDNFIDTDGSKYKIIQAPNGKYFNEYGSSNAGPFETEGQARAMMQKHRPKVINERNANKITTAMGISPEEAEAFVSGKGHLLQNGGYNGVSNVKDAPVFEYNTKEQNMSKEAENWADTILTSTVKRTPTENLQKIVGYWKEISNIQNDAYSAKMLQVYENELKQRK